VLQLAFKIPKRIDNQVIELQIEETYIGTSTTLPPKTVTYAHCGLFWL